MILESRFWKDDLLRLADRLRWARGAPPSSMQTYVTIEKAVLLGAFITRRLVESHKVSDGTSSIRLRVARVPNRGQRVTLANSDRLDELFDFGRRTRARLTLRDFCNQAIHSYVMAVYTSGAAKRVAGVFVASDRQRNRSMYAVSLLELERAFRKVARDYPSLWAGVFDDKLGDYRVTVLADRPTAAGR